jgi:hypothetical protein
MNSLLIIMHDLELDRKWGLGLLQQYIINQHAYLNSADATLAVTAYIVLFLRLDYLRLVMTSRR